MGTKVVPVNGETVVDTVRIFLAQKIDEVVLKILEVGENVENANKKIVFRIDLVFVLLQLDKDRNVLNIIDVTINNQSTVVRNPSKLR